MILKDLPELVRLHVALIMLDVTSGNIKQFTILRNISPGNLMYIMSRWDHVFPLKCLRLRPHDIPIITPIKVVIINLCFDSKSINLDIAADFIEYAVIIK